jgi:uncharacterized protein
MPESAGSIAGALRHGAMADRFHPRDHWRYSGSDPNQQFGLYTQWHACQYCVHASEGERNLMNLAWPFQIDARGRTATATDDAHIHDLIEQLLFTNPGERVNRPAFGTGVIQLVFSPNSDTLAAALQVTVQSALQQWLQDLIEVEDLQVIAEDATLRVSVSYNNRTTGQSQTAEFVRTL